MKRPNRKRKLKGLPLLYKSFINNQIIPFAYKCKEINKVLTKTGRIASQSDLNLFRDKYVKFSKQGYSEIISANMAYEFVKDKGLKVEKYLRAKRKLAEKKYKQLLKKKVV